MSKLGGTDHNDRGDAPEPPMGREGQVGQVGRVGEGLQADDSKVGRDGTTERRTGAKTRRVGVITTAHPKKIFSRFFRLQKIARGRGF